LLSIGSVTVNMLALSVVACGCEPVRVKLTT